ncbi:CHASE3 domain-containing protein [Pedobacter metabolipauper]|uniref:CHASE3 domain sensor protein n=1 Tax=Pedobacter metabolipauper TaxID=425513 RepID=A0A4R6SZ68_9SPHI|nr:CHASE3 domain-containing protein [Pedobacter metabolipauper]TDQ11924.1 CHASE3 domain sensor protein [Pedobacter metabolipauper]
MERIQKRSKRNLLIGFGFSLLILILSSVLSYISITQLIDSQQWVDHTAEVKLGLDKLVSRMKDAETGQRGYLLSNEETFLEPYTGAKDDVMDFFNSVQMLTIDNSSQQKDLPVLENLIKEKFEIIDGTVADKKRGIPPSTSTLLRGKQIMDSVRLVINAMTSREDKLMIIRNAEMNKFAVFTPIAIGIAALISMIITIVFYYRVRKDAQITVDLQNELIRKEEKKEKQIEIIGNIAKKIADGDYSTRIDKSELE